MYLRESALNKLRKVNLIENPEVRFVMLVKLINNEISYLNEEASTFEEYNRSIDKQIFGLVDEEEWLIEDKKSSS
jgi:hypothetical protein